MLLQQIETLYQCSKYIFHQGQGYLHHFHMLTFFVFIFVSAIIYFFWNICIGNKWCWIRIERFQVQTPLGTRPGLGTQPCYEVPGDLWAEYIKCKLLALGE